MTSPSLAQLVREVRKCRVCAGDLPLGPRPIVQIGRRARILVVGQAPGRLVHESGKPFDDPSGRRLREWMGISDNAFYDPDLVAIVPIGLCFPGTGRSGDLPPRSECAPLWHKKLLDQLDCIRLSIFVGSYALKEHLPNSGSSVAGAVMAWRDYGPKVVPLPHPSWRNNGWIRQNPWFEAELVPALRRRVQMALK